MIQELGWYFPDGETHLQEWMRRVNKRVDGPGGPRLTYQYHKYEAALPWIKERRCAVDVGAHVGLWSWFLARDFEYVQAVEPIPAHVDCWNRNVGEVCDNVSLLRCALGAERGTAVMRRAVGGRTPDSSGDTSIDPDPEAARADPEAVEVQVCRLDDLLLMELPVDFMKLDCEGYELFVLQGAAEILKRWRPTLIVEQKPETGFEQTYGVTAADCNAFLAELGAKRRQIIQGDYIFSWD